MERLWMTAIAALLAAMGLPGQSPSPEHAAVVDGNNRFALELYGQLRHRPGNLFLSPFSLRNALAMTLAGARNRTAEQMQEVLALPGQGEPVHRALADLARDLDASTGACELTVANSVWGQEGYEFLPDFLELQARVYGAEFAQVDFAEAEQACKTINAWVRKRTLERVPALLQPGDVTPSTTLVLADAIVFDGSWPRRFDADNTRPRPFHLGAVGDEVGRQVAVPTMYQVAEFGYYRDAELAILELPYDGGALSMAILLPRRQDGLAALEAAMTTEFLTARLQRLEPQRVGVFLPRYTADTRFRLQETLVALGMTDAFQGGVADFSGMTGNRDLFLDDVVHQARIDVTEEGTQAAGATAVMIARGGHVFRADHPFVFLVRERRSGIILFLGRITDPSRP